jgi:hypothetical protein
MAELAKEAFLGKVLGTAKRLVKKKKPSADSGSPASGSKPPKGSAKPVRSKTESPLTREQQIERLSKPEYSSDYKVVQHKGKQLTSNEIPIVIDPNGRLLINDNGKYKIPQTDMERQFVQGQVSNLTNRERLSIEATRSGVDPTFADRIRARGADALGSPGGQLVGGMVGMEVVNSGLSMIPGGQDEYGNKIGLNETLPGQLLSTAGGIGLGAAIPGKLKPKAIGSVNQNAIQPTENQKRLAKLTNTPLGGVQPKSNDPSVSGKVLEGVGETINKAFKGGKRPVMGF